MFVTRLCSLRPLYTMPSKDGGPKKKIRRLGGGNFTGKGVRGPENELHEHLRGGSTRALDGAEDNGRA